MLPWNLRGLFLLFLYGVKSAPLLADAALPHSPLPHEGSASPLTPESGQTNTTPPKVSQQPVDAPPSANQEALPTETPTPANSSSQAEVNAIDLLPHRATYGVTLDKSDKSYKDEDIVDVNGQMTIQLAKAGEGWAIEQKCTLHIYYKDGSAEQVITTSATYESMDGLKYSFNVRTLRGDDEQTISGDAILASKGGAGIVTYQEPDESTIQLPVGTIFPSQHLIGLLQAGIKGQKVVSNIVFDGSSETHEPVQVDTILAPSQDPKLALTNKDLFQAKRVWPMRMAIYAIDSANPEADYEITQNVLDQGVIRDMTLDYGTFKVQAVLNQVEVFLS